MINLLQLILCAIKEVAAGVGWFIVTIINLVIASLGLLLAALLALLPDMPDVPDPPAGGFLGALNWAFPVGPIAATMLGLVTLYIVFLAIRVALRWVKAI